MLSSGVAENDPVMSMSQLRVDPLLSTISYPMKVIYVISAHPFDYVLTRRNILYSDCSVMS